MSMETVSVEVGISKDKAVPNEYRSLTVPDVFYDSESFSLYVLDAEVVQNLIETDHGISVSRAIFEDDDDFLGEYFKLSEGDVLEIEIEWFPNTTMRRGLEITQ